MVRPLPQRKRTDLYGGWGLPQSELGNPLGWVGGGARGTGKPHPKRTKSTTPCLTTATQTRCHRHLGFSWRITFSTLFLGRSRWGSVAQPRKRREAIPATPSAPASQGCRYLDHISAIHPSATAPGRAGPAPSPGQHLGTHCTAMRPSDRASEQRAVALGDPRQAHCPICGCRAQHGHGVSWVTSQHRPCPLGRV